MKHLIKTLVLVCALLSSTSLLAQERSVLVVGMGGWASCINGIQKQFIAKQVYNLVSNLRASYPHRKIAYLMTCSKGLKTAFGSRPLHYYGPQGMGTYPQNQIHHVINTAKPDPDTDVYVIGHSHGGGTSMHAAVKLGRVAGIFTLEPVSPQMCTTRDYLRNRDKRLIKRRQRIIAGCRQAPRDVSWSAVSMAAGGSWHNYILDQSQYLGDIHSSPVTYAEDHYYRKGKTAKRSAHHLLGLDASVWTSVCQKIKSSMGVAQVENACAGLHVSEDGQ